MGMKGGGQARKRGSKPEWSRKKRQPWWRSRPRWRALAKWDKLTLSRGSYTRAIAGPKRINSKVQKTDSEN